MDCKEQGVGFHIHMRSSSKSNRQKAIQIGQFGHKPSRALAGQTAILSTFGVLV
jgi:hypothetical protein